MASKRNFHLLKIPKPAKACFSTGRLQKELSNRPEDNIYSVFADKNATNVVNYEKRKLTDLS